MNYLPKTPCAENEHSKLALLEDLFRAWYEHFTAIGSTLKKEVADGMVFDGFYPNYFNQTKKVLFIGREARDIAGCNYIDVLFPAYRTKKRIGQQHLNRSKFHSRMLNIAYGIINGMPNWANIPRADVIGNTFGAENGVSFAFMNISKLSNQGTAWSSDWGSINAAHQRSSTGRNFNQEQIAILEPDIVITMNLGDKLSSLGILEALHSTDLARSYRMNSGGHQYLLIDTFHFSAPRKRAAEHYYLPICEAIRRNEVHGGLANVGVK